MASDLFKKYKSLFTTTSNTFSTGSDVDITLASATGLPTDTDITLTFDRVDSAGAETSGLMERITGTISGVSFTIKERGVDGTTEQSHTSPVVEMIWNAHDWNTLIDALLVNQNQDGSFKDIDITTLTASMVNASDTVTASNVAASVGMTIAGVEAPSISSTNTLTNKRITKRVTTITSHATPTVNTDNCDVVTITAQAEDITSMTTNLSGTPTNFQTLVYRILDNGSSRAITWGASFQAMGVDLPTTTTASKVLTVGFIYDTADSKWGCVAVSEES